MKTMIASLIVALTTMHSFVQAQVNSYSYVQPTSNGIPTDIRQNDKVFAQNNNATTYRLFPTQNMWTFIKLNTRNGLMWQVQFDTKANNRFVTDFNYEPLVTKGEEVDDQFTLYATQNMYTFILLDQLNGKTWQVQWSTEIEHRVLVPIE
jgi:hypothetical protein